MEAEQVINKILSEAQAEADKIKSTAQQKLSNEQAQLDNELSEYKKQTDELFTFIKRSTKESDVIIFHKPRVIALYCQRKSASYQLAKTDKELWEFFDRINAKYLVETKYYKIPRIRGNAI